MSSKNARFACLEHDRFRCEQLLIQQHTPCLNTPMNPQPVAIPARCYSPYTSLKFSHHPRRFIQQAAGALKAEKKKAWLAQSEE